MHLNLIPLSPWIYGFIYFIGLFLGPPILAHFHNINTVFDEKPKMLFIVLIWPLALFGILLLMYLNLVSNLPKGWITKWYKDKFWNY